MALNAPQFPPEHPINRITPNFTCPKCNIPNGLARALQYGEGDKFPGKVYHFCAATPGCKGVRSYTPPPLPGGQGPAVPVAHYPAYYAAGYAPPGFAPFPPPVPQPGQPPAVGPVPPPPHMAWGFPPGYAPPYPMHLWPPAVPPAHAAAAQPGGCPGPLCRAKDPPERRNQACTLKFCKNCCQAQLLDDERALRSHDGCRIHKRDAFRPNADGAAPARHASPPIDPVLRDPAPSAAGHQAAPHALPAAAPALNARPGIGRSLELDWATIGEAQTQQQLALGTKRRQVAMAKLHRVTVVLWHSNDFPYRRFEVPVASLACFSLATDANEFLQTAGIMASMFERYDLSIQEWTMVKREATMPVLALQHLLFRVFGITTCVNFAKALDLASSASSIPQAAAGSKRLGEDVTSPPRGKRARVSPLLEDPPNGDSSSRAHDHDTPRQSPTIVDDEDLPGPRPSQEPGASLALQVQKAGQHFPGDFFFCDVVNALQRSVVIAKARKKQPRDGRARKRHEVLGELLQTTIPPATLSHTKRALNALQHDNPTKYNDFMHRGHTSAGCYKNSTSSRSSQPRRSVSSRPSRKAGSTSRTHSPSPPTPRSSSARTTRSASTRTTRSTSAHSTRSGRALRAPSPSSGMRDLPIEIEDSQSGSDFTPADSSDSASPVPVSPLSKRIRELEDEQELLRPAPPIDVELLPKVIDWNRVIERATKLLPELWKIVDDPGSHVFCQELCSAFRAKRSKTPLTLKQKCLVTEFVHAGYYGPNGLGLAMSMTIAFKDVRLYSDEAYEKIQPLRTEIFVERVLVRELILLLIKEDFSLNDEDSDTLYERTKWVGDKNHPLPPDEGLEPTSAADLWNLRRANERRREIEEEERRELEEERRKLEDERRRLEEEQTLAASDGSVAS